MDRVWRTSSLGDELALGDEPITAVEDVVEDMTSGGIDIALLVSNMASVLTHKDAACRKRGVNFLSAILHTLPPGLLSQDQLRFISNFYADRLRDHHSVIPAVLDGYLALVRNPDLPPQCVAQFLLTMFNEIACQSQMRTERRTIYQIIQLFLRSFPNQASAMGDDLLCGVLTSIDGERDPHNLLLVLELVPELLRVVSLKPNSKMAEEVMEILTCYFPIDYTPSPTDSSPVTRTQLANALADALTVLPNFAEPCLLLLVEKLDSSLRLAKIDSLQLLEKSCATFLASSYTPFVKTLWSSIRRELASQSDDELKSCAHRGLHALIHKVSRDEKTLDGLLRIIIASTQTALTDAKTPSSFKETAKIFLTCVDASKESCRLTGQLVIPAVVALHSFSGESKSLKAAALSLLRDLHVAVRHWGLLNDLLEQTMLTPSMCADLITDPDMKYRYEVLDTLKETADALPREKVSLVALQLTEQSTTETNTEISNAAVACLRQLCSLHSDILIDSFKSANFRIDNTEKDCNYFHKKLIVWSNLAAVNSFTDLAMKGLLRLVDDGDTAVVTADALHTCVSDTSICSSEKVQEIEKDYGLIHSILKWLSGETANDVNPEELGKGYSLVAVTMQRLSSADQSQLIEKHSQTFLNLCEQSLTYLLILEALFNSLHRDVQSDLFPSVAKKAVKGSLYSGHDLVRHKSCILVAHLLNKLDSGEAFNNVYSVVKETLAPLQNDTKLRPKMLFLYAWITRSLLLRGDECFTDWLEKIISSLYQEEWCEAAADSISIIVTDERNSLSIESYCRVSPLYTQRLQGKMLEMTPEANGSKKVQQAVLLAWAYVLSRLPEKVLKIHLDKTAPLLLESLTLGHPVLLQGALRAVETAIRAKAFTLQTLLPRLLTLTTYQHSMDVRRTSLDCLYWTAQCYGTPQLLPHRSDTISRLGAPLDDSKRLVRAAAVRARSRWILVGSPGESAPPQ